MAVEIERKFLVSDDGYRAVSVGSIEMVQGYLAVERGRTVRVRIGGEKGFLTVKGPSADGVSRSEWEYGIPVGEAREMLRLCDGVIEKVRYLVPVGGHTFEVDEFHGDNDGLVVAEVELHSADEPLERPAWLGREVTGDRRYYNAHLVGEPYRLWRDRE